MKMTELRDALEDAGFAGVSTLQVAGNILFDEARSGVADQAAQIRATVLGRFGHDLAVIIRSHGELVDALGRHPFIGDADPSWVSIAFLEGPPSISSIEAIDHHRFSVERFAVSGSEIFMCHPDGQGRSRLTLSWLERQLDVVGTARNVNTVAKLIEMTA